MIEYSIYIHVKMRLIHLLTLDTQIHLLPDNFI